MVKIIYYYQTFVGLKQVLQQKPLVITHLIVSSIHFGYNQDTPYIHLNDNLPTDKIFDSLWSELKLANKLGIKIMVMLGGAGGAYAELFSNYNKFYLLLRDFIISKPFIEGIDLDVEEPVKIELIKGLINQINKDFGNNFIITMAPLGSSLMYDTSGMGGFCYKNLYKSEEGKKIEWFNGQFYGNYSFSSYEKTINNNYQESKIVMGMLSNQNLPDILVELKKIKNKYNIAGVFVWEYFDAPPDNKNHVLWSENIYQIINKYIT